MGLDVNGQCIITHASTVVDAMTTIIAGNRHRKADGQARCSVAFSCWGDRSLHPLYPTMANAGIGRTQSAVPSTNHDGSDVVDVYSDSSGDKVPRLAGSPSVDSDATLSEESDAGSAMKGPAC